MTELFISAMRPHYHNMFQSSYEVLCRDYMLGSCSGSSQVTAGGSTADIMQAMLMGAEEGDSKKCAVM